MLLQGLGLSQVQVFASEHTEVPPTTEVPLNGGSASQPGAIHMPCRVPTGQLLPPSPEGEPVGIAEPAGPLQHCFWPSTARNGVISGFIGNGYFQFTMMTSSTSALMYGPRMPKCSSSSPRSSGCVKESSMYSRKTTLRYCWKGFLLPLRGSLLG